MPIPKFSYNAPYLELVFYRSSESVTRLLPDNVIDSLNRDELSGLAYLSTKTTITKSDYAEHMNYDDRKAQRHLKKFVELGLLHRVGAGPSTRYEVVMR